MHCGTILCQTRPTRSPPSQLFVLSERQGAWRTAAATSGNSSSYGMQMGSGESFTNEKLHSSYSSPNIVRVMKSRRLKWTGNVARMEEGRNTFKILTGTPTGKRPLGRHRYRWKDNIRIDFKEICINTRNWVDSTQDREHWKALVNVVLNL